MIKGKIYKAYSQRDLQQTKPLYAFVPNDLVIGGKLDLGQYSGKRWDSINCGANKRAVGSHVFPDLSQPITQSELEGNDSIQEFLTRVKQLTQKSYGAPNPFRKPGKQREQLDGENQPHTPKV
jgi:hypothetical protein